MQLGPTAHTDTFSRDNLPPLDAVAGRSTSTASIIPNG